jgi:hypothetical protein
MQDAKVGLTIPILPDTFHAVTYDFFVTSETEPSKASKAKKEIKKVG